MNPEIKAAEPPVEILIVEDSPTQSMLLQGILETSGFRVSAAENGRAALQSLASRRPTLVISDIQMPGMDGYELCRTIKTDPALAAIPVMLLTSLSAPQDIIRGLECGADNFVVKPYEKEFLLSRIQTILANQLLRKSIGAEKEITIFFAGRHYVITSDRRQILNLLLTTYETAISTNRKLIQAHEELKAAQAQLIEAEKLTSLGRLAAGIAHEVRNPLAIMEMGIGFLSGQSASAAGNAVLEEMKEAVDRANQVINELMDLSSPRELGMRAADLNALLEKSLDALRDRHERAGILLAKNLDPALPPCRVDAGKIGQVFVNVLTNAFDAMAGGGTLTVATSSKGSGAAAFDAGDRSGARVLAGNGSIVIEVADTGPGIAPENLTKLFEPFFSTKPTGKGMGLGLTVARKIVELHCGKIEVANRQGGGAKVTLTFPCTTAPS
jgi:signal transduction histidine kinase